MSLFDPFDVMPPSPRCPRCRMPMWFSRLEPHPTDHTTIDNFVFQCACGELLMQSLPRQCRTRLPDQNHAGHTGDLPNGAQ